MRAMERGSGTYNVGGGVEASVREAIAILEGLAGRTLEIREHDPVPGDQRRTNADTTRIRSELGWAPKVSLEDGLRAQWEWASATVGAPMSPDSERQSAVELEAEQEVDFGRYAQTIAARWWLLVVGAVLGALIGFLVSLSDGKIYKATAQVYLGQPLAPDSAAAVTTSPTTLGLVQAFVVSEEAIEKAASAAGLRPSKLRDARHRAADPGHVDHEAGVSGAAALDPGHGLQRAGRRPPRRTTSRSRPWTRSGAYTNTKIDTLDQQLAYIDTQIGLVKARLSRARARRRGRSSATAASAPSRSSSRSRTSTPRSRSPSSAWRRWRSTASTRRARCRSPRTSRRAASRRRRWPCGRSRRAGGRACSSAPSSASCSGSWRRCSGIRCRAGIGRAHGLSHARRQDRSRRRPRVRRGEAAPGDAGGHPRVRRPHLRRGRRVEGRHGCDGGRVDARVQLIRHEQNRGVGAAIVTGYRQAIADRVDVTCVMAADNQMAPDELEADRAARRRRRRRLREGEPARLGRGVAADPARALPRQRDAEPADEDRVGLLARRRLAVRLHRGLARRRSSGSTSTAIYPRYGFPNDMLVHLNVVEARVRDVPSRPVYNVGEQSGIRYSRVIPAISWLLLKAFFWRLWQKYVIRDFHPLVFFYVFGIAMFLAGLGLGIAEVVLRILGNPIPPATVVLVALLLLFGSQFTLFAMWFDLERQQSCVKGSRGAAEAAPRLEL